jgi:hypothetical protein
MTTYTSAQQLGGDGDERLIQYALYTLSKHAPAHPRLREFIRVIQQLREEPKATFQPRTPVNVGWR